ncbi:hypothetical protein B0T10DRAFT_417962, partial [Thelonectria olida]
MSASVFISTSSGPLHPRKPLETQKNTGGDMSMVFFVQPDCPSRFAYPDKHRIKGLNAEAIARVYLPLPSWIMATEYITLRADPDNSSTCIFFNGWFLMNGRVHPYALTWEIEQDDGSESEQNGF